MQHDDTGGRDCEGHDLPGASIVIPTFNRCEMVSEAIDSVLAQTQANFEVIVVDDGSTDGTPEMLRDRYGDEPRVRVVTQPNAGTASARNLGLENARAPYTGFLDSDDLWQPEFLVSQIESLESQRGDAVMCDAVYLGGTRRGRGLFTDPTWRPPTSFDRMLAGGWGLPSALLVRTDAARSVGFATEYSYGEDTEFLLRFHAAGYRLVLNPSPLATWRAQARDRKTADTEFEHHLAGHRMLAPHRHHPNARRRIRYHVYRMHREIAQELVRSGCWHEARPHLAAWARLRPHRARVVVRWLRSLLARPSDPPPDEATRRRSAKLRAVLR